MATLVGILVLVVGLLVSIALHEIGHMVPAKKFGVRVSEYFVGFGPTLFSRRGRDTEYGVKAIPLGGYVRLVGMIPPEDRVKPVRVRGWAARVIADTRAAAVEEIQPGEEHRAFYQLAWWKKVIVMAGGPLVNLVLAVVIFTVVLTAIGAPAASLTLHSTAPCTPASGADECVEGDPISPAEDAGFVAGDTITAVDGQVVSDWSHASDLIAASPGRSIVIDIDRDGQAMALSVTPAPREVVAEDGSVTTVGYLGVYSLVTTQRQSPVAGLVMTGEYLGLTARAVATLPVHVWQVTRAAVGLEERSPEGIMGVIGVGRVAGEISSAQVEGYTMVERMGDLLMLLGALNLALFAFNMIPLVPLDGGHIASALWQGLKNRLARLRGTAPAAPVDVARMMPLAYAVFALLLVMGGILIYADIVAPVALL